MTLIEVMVALVILSVGVSALMVAMGRGLALVKTTRTRETARALIRQVDIEMPIDKTSIEETVESGEFDDFPGYSWTREVMLVDEEERPGLFYVTTRIEWTERGRDTFEEVTVIQYAPNAESVTRKF